MIWAKELEAAKRIAKSSGDFLLQHQNDKEIILNDGRDIKLEVDKEIEKYIIDNLMRLFNYALLSEEIGIVGEIEKDKPYWIIDPLDGTMNFLVDIPIAAISIALWVNDGPIFGVVNLFNENKLIHGLVGSGIYLNEKQLTIDRLEKEVSQSILMTGFPLNLELNDQNLTRFTKFSRQFKKVRMVGSAASSLTYVALGRAEVYWEEEIMLWDVAAGISLVMAANGDVRIRQGMKNQWSRNILAMKNVKWSDIDEI